MSNNRIRFKLVQVDYGDKESEILDKELKGNGDGTFPVQTLDLENTNLSMPQRCYVQLDDEAFSLNQYKHGGWECRAGDVVDCYGAEIEGKKFKGVIRFDGFPSYKDRHGKPYFKLLIDIFKLEVPKNATV